MKTENQATTGTQPKISDGNSDLFVFDCIHLFGGACLLKISERDSHPFQNSNVVVYSCLSTERNY